MVYLLYGPDSLRRGRKLKELVDAYRKKYENPDILEIDFSEKPDVLCARDFLNQPSLFVAAKVLIVKNSAEAPEEKEPFGAAQGKLARILKSELKTEKSFVFVSDAAAPKKALAFLLDKPAISQEFPELSLRELKNFVQKESEKMRIKFEPGALEIFAEIIFGRAEGRSWHALRELEKLSALSFSAPLSKNTLFDALYLEEEKRVFDSARKILSYEAANFSKTPETAGVLSELESLFAAKASPAYVFNSLGFQARGEDAVRLANYDISVKSGKLEYEEALLDFVLNKQ